MKVLNKEQLAKIETSFRVLKGGKEYGISLKVLEETLSEAFDGNKFIVKVIVPSDINIKNNLFVMSVYPEVSTVNKIIDAVLSNKDSAAIKKLWESNKNWTIEIDKRILDNNFISLDEKELTSLLLHEVGHIVVTNSIPSRISLILRYEIEKSKFSSRSLLHMNIFKTIMSLPIFDACVADDKKSKSSIKDEIKADSFVKSMGYSNYLFSSLTKLSSCKMYGNNADKNKKMQSVSMYSKNMLNDFQLRKDKLVKKNLLALRESIDSEFITEILDNTVNTLFEDSDTMVEGDKINFFHEKADKLLEGDIYEEFFIFKSKKLKKIDNFELDYIDSKISDMKDETDRMMVVNYIRSKLDLVQYYISILNDPSLSKKYLIPHSLDQLHMMEKRLNLQMQNAIKFKLPMANRVTYISWPSGPARALYIPDVDWPEGYEG